VCFYFIFFHFFSSRVAASDVIIAVKKVYIGAAPNGRRKPIKTRKIGSKLANGIHNDNLINLKRATLREYAEWNNVNWH